jgi:transcriptional regulator with XRE-family HTH domain
MDKAGFSQRLKTLRETFSVSQLKLAEGLGFKQYYVAKWESGAYEPNTTIQQKIANYFRVSPIWLTAGIGHIYTGIVFIPRNLMLPQKRLDLSFQQRIAHFICEDGARDIAIVANTDKKADGIILFKREDDLLLFLPYVSFFSTRSRYDLTSDMLHILIPCRDIESPNKLSGSVLTSKHEPTFYSLPTDMFYMINSTSSLEDIEKVLEIVIPENLKENYSASTSGDETEIKKIGWEFTAELRFGNFKGISESKAIEAILNIENLFNDANKEQKINIVKLKRKK